MFTSTQSKKAHGSTRLEKFRAFVALILVLMLVVPPARAGQVTATFVTPGGTAIANGTLTFTLSQLATKTDSSQTIAATPFSCYTSTDGTLVGLPNPLVAPSLSSISGSFTAGTYFVEISYWNASGETLVSPEQTITLSASQGIQVTGPVLQPASATGYNIYVGITSGGEVLQANITGFATQNLTTLNGGGSPLTSNSSDCLLSFNDTLVPAYTTYLVSFSDVTGAPVPGFPQRYYLQGSTENLNTAPPAAGLAARFPQPIVANPIGTATQSINSNLSLNGFSLLNAHIINGILQPTELLSSGLISTNGNTGLPASTPGGFFAVGGFISPSQWRVFIGDGTGWQAFFSKRVTSTTTDLFGFQDNGTFNLFNTSGLLGASIKNDGSGGLNFVNNAALTLHYDNSGNLSVPGKVTSSATGSQSSSGIQVQAAIPATAWDATGQAVDQHWWDCVVAGTVFECRAVNDAASSAQNWIVVQRGSGASVSSVLFSETVIAPLFLAPAGSPVQLQGGSGTTNDLTVLNAAATKQWLVVPDTGGVQLGGSSSGTVTLQPQSAASGTLTLPNGNDQLIARNTTDHVTNKRVDPRFVATPVATNAPVTLTPDADDDDLNAWNLTGTAGTLTIAAPSPSTPTDGQKQILRIKTTNSWTYSFNTIYRFSTTTPAPVSSSTGKTDYFGLMWNATDSKWDVVGVDQGH